MDPNLRNLKDFLTLYNKVTELCFARCVDSMNERDLTTHETTCVDNCVNKFARFNQKMMSVYVEVQTDINQRRMVEMEQLQNQQQQQQQQQPLTEATNALPAATTESATTTAATPALAS